MDSDIAQRTICGYYSDRISIMPGVRQVCPLSPLLVALALEALATIIRQNKQIKGFRIHQIEVKLALYANDIACLLEDPLRPIKKLHQVTGQFGQLSGKKSNERKSVCTGFNISAQTKLCILEEIPVQWQNGGIRYLGIKLCRTNEQMIYENITPIVA